MIRRAIIFLCTFAALSLALRAEDKPKDAAVIYPRQAAGADATTPTRTSDSNYLLIVLAAGAAVAGGWMLWRQRRTPGGVAGRHQTKLAIAESRSLGNRQYLVVADYDGKKFLLGVCPGSITMLTPLEEEDEDDPRV